MPPDTSPAAITPAVSSTPSPSPSAAPSPAAPAPSPSSASPSSAVSPEGEATSVMDSFDKQFDDIAPAPDKPTETPAQVTPPKTGEKPIAAPKPEPKTETVEGEEGFDAPQSGTLIQVRNWGRRMADMAKNAQKKSKELQAKLQEAEQRQPKLPPDIEKIQQDYARLQKENDDHRQRLAQADYSRSPEYEEKFKVPYETAYRRGRAAVMSLRVTEPAGTDEATGDPKFTTRQGTADDFEKLYNMTDSDADAAAAAMFGPSARRVTDLRDRAKDLAETAWNAVAENTKKFGEQRQKTQAQMAQRGIALQGLWKKINDDLQKNHAEWFGEKQNDTEWNEGLTKGRSIAQQRFSQAYMNLTPEQRVLLDAQIFNRASAFTPLTKTVTTLRSELATAQKTIEQLRGSSPGKPAAGAVEAAKDHEDNWEADFNKVVK